MRIRRTIEITIETEIDTNLAEASVPPQIDLTRADQGMLSAILPMLRAMAEPSPGQHHQHQLRRRLYGWILRRFAAFFKTRKPDVKDPLSEIIP